MRRRSLGYADKPPASLEDAERSGIASPVSIETAFISLRSPRTLCPWVQVTEGTKRSSPSAWFRAFRDVRGKKNHGTTREKAQISLFGNFPVPIFSVKSVHFRQRSGRL